MMGEGRVCAARGERWVRKEGRGRWGWRLCTCATLATKAVLSMARALRLAST